MRPSKTEAKIIASTKAFFGLAQISDRHAQLRTGLVLYDYADQGILGYVVINSDFHIFEVELSLKTHSIVTLKDVGFYTTYLKTEFGQTIKNVVFTARNMLKHGLV